MNTVRLSISDNLADKAKTLGIPLFDFRKGRNQQGSADNVGAKRIGWDGA